MRLGPYAILGPLGAGGMGEVYRARDERLGRDVAVKVLPADASSDPECLRRLETEARAAGQLDHPNILAIHDVGVHRGSPYIVAELLEGETLRARLAGAFLPARRAIDYAVQIARGLAAAHEKGIVHRDLKPENLFVTRDGRLKILDFGLAKRIRSGDPAAAGTSAPTMTAATAPGTLLGTAGYMSPEQVRGGPVDHRSDIFALGTILYEMLAGRRPFGGSSDAETMSAILRDDPPRLTETNPAVPAALERIVRHCVEKSPGERFQAAGDVGFALEAVSDLPTPAPGARVIDLPPARPRLRWMLAGLGVLAALAAGLIAGRMLAGKSVSLPAGLPVFQQLTFRRGTIWAARFAPDGQTVVYSASWEGNPVEIFLKRREGAESLPLALSGSSLLAISSSGEMAISRHFRPTPAGPPTGTLARVSLSGGAPRDILEDVQQADWAPHGAALAVVRTVGGHGRLEFPIGTTLYETTGHLSFPRVSPGGKRIAFFDHPFAADDRGSVAVVDREGARRTLSSGWETLQGLAWSPTGDEVWFTAAKSGMKHALYAAALSGGERLVARLPGGMIIQDIFRDGRVLLTLDQWRHGILALPHGENKERELSWLEGSYVSDISPDGRTLLFSEEGEAMGPNYAVCLRKTDGSAPVRLDEGEALALSPDGRWVLSRLASLPGHLVLLPTGPGAPRRLKHETINEYDWAAWFPDGKQILFSGHEGGRRARCYAGDLEGGRPRPITPEGTSTDPFGYALSPDGRLLAMFTHDDRAVLHPVEGGEPRPIQGVEKGDRPIRWSADGRSLFIRRPGEWPARIFRLDLATGRRKLVREIAPSDPAGVISIWRIVLAPDGASYAYTYGRRLSDLYLVEGLR
jgi:Tol biopolymer transport system component